MKHWKALQNGINLLILLCLAVLILCPLFMIFARAVIIDGRPDFSYALNIIFNPENLRTITNSLLLGAAVVLVTTILGIPFAYLITRTQLAKHKWIDIVIMIPFMTPPFISSMGFILFMQKNGLLQQLFPFTGRLSESFFSFWGLVLVMSLHVLPFMISILKNAMLNISSSLDEAGQIFGGNFFYRFRRILAPLLSGNYAIGALLVFVKTLSEYGTPATFGTRIGFYVFTTDIHRHSTTSPIDFGKAASLSSVLVLICILMWMLQNTVTARHTYRLVGGKGSRSIQKKLPVFQSILAWGYLLLIFFMSIVVPYFSIIMTSLIKLRGYGLQADNFTLAHYAALFSANSKGRNAIFTSLFLAFAAAFIASAIGVVIVLAARRKKAAFLSQILEAISLLPEMLPSIVLVIGIMLFWNLLYPVLPLYNTLGIMILTYVVLYLPYAVQYTTSAFIQLGDSLVQAGRTFGGSGFYIFRTITFPLIFRGILTGFMMIFIISFRELVAASMVAPPSTLTVSTFIMREFEQGSVSVGCAMAVICVFLTTGILMALKYVSSKGNGQE